MYHIVIVTSRKDDFGEFGEALENTERNVSLQWVRSGSAALNIAAETTPELVIVDETLEDMGGLELIRKLLGANAMTNTVLVSSLSSSEFHEATEGLGILAHLPVVPDKSDANRILNRLVEVVGAGL